MASFPTVMILSPPPQSLPFLLQSQHQQQPSNLSSLHNPQTLTIFTHNPFPRAPKMAVPAIRAQAITNPTGLGLVQKAIQSFQSSPPTWQSAILSNLVIFVVGSPILLSGLSLPGIGASFLLGTLTWRAFGPSGFLLVASYFVIGTAATKLKMAQKEAQGVAEKKKGRRGPESVIGSSAAGCVCAFLSIFAVGGIAFSRIWELGFVASFCTKLSDTVSSEVGKAYGKTTYLVTTFKTVPRGTEGAVSAEGTLAGLLASILLSSVGCLMGELNNDVVNVINISMGSVLAILIQLIVLQNWYT
ncbi:protein VTE6, chloroplastic-like isoform X4 [Camellia sinensis]|uniref:protein VTE6, chloroplastic-like isoform X3 n=1 Tax=Camellia sinensis TaxID=4442 RepID=UPI00103692F7|nr:protein VTE6, chloroplastic-like isoform X3 [Camellia sinensis]XP_028053796.1 protein VTE6, chloroplastic-like isoform X4 [Camellia sinensis]